MDWTKGWIPKSASAGADDLAQAVAAFNAAHGLLELFAGHCELRRTGATNGGEFHGPCPKCGGVDRFMAWPAKGRAWCRRCGTQGDTLHWAMILEGRDPGARGETARFLRERGHLPTKRTTMPHVRKIGPA
ncbi:MAG: hypothetical protein HPKKFMNG_00994 [Planctomycetes bacterium]|nr:hypothetical protein [Planctomycetota bacterium]